EHSGCTIQGVGLETSAHLWLEFRDVAAIARQHSLLTCSSSPENIFLAGSGDLSSLRSVLYEPQPRKEWLDLVKYSLLVDGAQHVECDLLTYGSIRAFEEIKI